MNPRPISDARDTDLRLSEIAMARAAVRARDIAQQTGTDLVVSENGVIKRIRLRAAIGPYVLQEPTTEYGKAP